MKGWKTLGFNAAAAILTVVIGFNWADALPQFPWVAPLIITLANIGLRFVTTTPIGKSE